MKNIHILPTDKDSKLYLGNLGKPVTIQSASAQFKKPLHIYITNDEEIKEGDWFYEPINKSILKYNSKSNKLIKAVFSGFCKKIILTTDKDLIADGVQSIPDEFLEWFVKNPSCDEVDFELLFFPSIKSPNGKWQYNIIIPKEELSKDEIDKFFVDMICNPKEEPKQEILENRSNAYDFIDFDDIEKQIAITETRGEKVVKYLDKYKGQSIYNEIALAIEFGYQLKLEEDE
jgi:hypothetical protein